MSRQDAATRRVTTGIVAAVALFAGGTSYTHIYSLAREHGQAVLSSALLPLSADGLIAAASAVILIAARTGTVPKRARLLLALGVGATVGANLAYGMPHGTTGAVLSVFPAVSFIGCTELLVWMREHLTASRSASRTAPVPAVAASASASEAASDELRDRRERKVRQPATDLFQSAEKMFPNGMNPSRGKPASLRDIQAGLGVGQSRAQEIQGHFRSLAAAG